MGDSPACEVKKTLTAFKPEDMCGNKSSGCTQILSNHFVECETITSQPCEEFFFISVV